ncbi:MAG: S8 family serine peptidase [Paracoccus sp. (in: a-proteobacteria)]|nr:S8 family serine peptidase [Paracoccus sp. (in: a-proteobacteria)]
MPRPILLLLIAALALTTDLPRLEGFGISAAWAGDDDDDDDGGARNDDDDDAPAVIRRRTRTQPQRAAPRAPQRQTRRAPAPPPPPPPVRASNEVIARALTPEALIALTAQGYESLRSVTLNNGDEMHRLRIPGGTTPEQAAEALRQAGGVGTVDYNHYYRGEQAEDCQGIDCPARAMIDWPSELACGTPPRVGMIDTGLNPDHATFAKADLTLHRLDSEATDSGLVHGTAVAALLVGAGDTRSPGLIGHAPLLAVDAFHRSQNDERADAFSLVEALDWLAAQDVRVINMSLAGPDNALLAEKVATMEDSGILVVAAAGNAGPRAAPAYPAAYDSVVAVTAVDRRGEVYRRAGRGAHIDLAAPGVDVWTAASISGARTKTGTSFAAPFVTAAAALILQDEPELTPAELRERLGQSAVDLGSEGRDEIFGAGLLSVSSPCTARGGGYLPAEQ